MAAYHALLPATEFEPDAYNLYFDSLGQPLPPSDDHVMSRNEHGEALSRYGDKIWDLSPYQTTTTGYSRFFFYNWVTEPKGNVQGLVDEFKWLLCVLIYFPKTGNAGYLSVSTLQVYSNLLADLCRFSAGNSVSIARVLSEEKLLRRYLKDDRCRGMAKVKALAGLLQHFLTQGHDIAGVTVSGVALKEVRQLSNERKVQERQTPVIPTRIYSELLKRLHATVDGFLEAMPSLGELIKKALSDKYYARSKGTQRLNGISEDNYRKDFNEALIEYHLVDYAKRHRIGSVKSLVSHLGVVQFSCKNLIHAYTGMRHNEVMALRYDCLQIEARRNFRLLVSETTKLVGVRKKERWVTSQEIDRVIVATQAIAELIINHKTSLQIESPLFISTAYLGCAGREPTSAGVECSKLDYSPHAFTANITIEESDIRELEKVDPFRNWRADIKYQIGSPWPLRSHQFRRSLAVYVAQSGLVSLPSLKRQLKHLTREMTLYYTKGFEGAVSLFGDNKDHFRHELNRVKPEADALAYLYSVLLSKETQFGAHGTWVEKNIKPDGRTKILGSRETLIKKFRDGEIAYSETHLGACTQTGPCDKRAMRSISACVYCKSASINASRLDSVIDAQQALVNLLDSDSMIYRTEEEQLTDLKRMKNEMRERA